jgi:hypothetical protein
MADETTPTPPSLDLSISAGGDTSWMNDIIPQEGEGDPVAESPTPEVAPVPDAVATETPAAPEAPKYAPLLSDEEMLKNYQAQEEGSAPVATAAPVAPEKVGAMKAFGVSAANEVVPATAGLYGFVKGAAVGAKIPAPPVVKAGAAIATGLAGAFGANYVTSIAQKFGIDHLLPKDVSENWERLEKGARTDSPKAAMLGSAAAQLPTMRPSLASLRNSAEAAKMLFSDSKGFSQYIATPEGQAAAKDLVGVAFGAGSQVATEAVNQLMSGQLDLAKLAGAVIIGAVLNKETKLGAKITGSSLKVPEVPKAPSAADITTAATEMSTEQLLLPLTTSIEDYRMRNGLEVEGGATPAPVDPPISRTDNLTEEPLPLSTELTQPEFKLEGEVGASERPPLLNFDETGQSKFEFFGDLTPNETKPVDAPVGTEVAPVTGENPNQANLPLEGGATYPTIKPESTVADVVNSGAEVRASFNGTKGILSVDGDMLLITPLGKKNKTPIEVSPIGDNGNRPLNEIDGLKLLGEQKKPTPKAKLEEWADNTIKERNKKKRGNVNMGAGDPVNESILFSAYIVKGAYKISRGTAEFAAWSAEMVKDFGEAIKPHLESIWQKSQAIHSNPESVREVLSTPMPNADPRLSLKINDIVSKFSDTKPDVIISQVNDSGVINLAKYGDSDSAVKDIADVAAAFEPELAKANGGRRTGEAVMKDVQSWFKDNGLDDVLAKLQGQAGKSGQKGDTFALAGMLVIGKAQQEVEAAKAAWMFNRNDPVADAAYRKSLDTLFKYLRPAEAGSSDAGRALAAYRWSPKWLDQATFALNGDNPIGALNKLPLTFNQKAVGAAGEALVNSVLGFKSAVGNIIGGMGQSILRPVEIYMGGIFNGNIPVADVGLKMFAFQLEAVSSAARSAWVSFKTLEPVFTGHTKIDEARGGAAKNPSQYGNSVDGFRSRGFISSETMGLDPKSNPFMAPIVDSLGEVFRFSQRLMIPTDEFFKSVNGYAMGKAKFYLEGKQNGLKGADLDLFVKNSMEKLIDRNGKLYNPENIKREVYQEIVSEGLTGDAAQAEFTRRITERMDSNVGEVSKSVQDFAEEVTFQQRQMSTPEGKPTVAKSFGNFMATHPALRLITGMYFVNTPINIFRWTAQRFPVGIIQISGIAKKINGYKGLERLHLQHAQDMASGDPIRMASAQGKQATGAMIMGMAGYAAAQGYLTGAGAFNVQENKAQRATGWLPYSVKLPKNSELVKLVADNFGGHDSEDEGNIYIQFNRIDPIGTHLMWFAEVGDLMRNPNLDASASSDEKLQAAMYSSGLAAGKLFYEKSTLTNIKQALMFVDPANWQTPKLATQTFMKYALKRLAPVAVPSVISQPLTAADPDLNEARGVLQNIANRLGAGISNELGMQVNKQRNILGEPIDKAVTGLTFFDAISPVLISEDRNDKVLKEFADDGYSYSAPPRLSSPNGVKQAYDMRDFVNDKGQDAYDRWQEITSETKVEGKTLRDSLVKLIDSKQYKALPAQSTVENGYYTGRVQLKQQLVQAYRDAALAQVKKEFPEFAKIQLGDKAMKAFSKVQSKEVARESVSQVQKLIDSSK